MKEEKKALFPGSFDPFTLGHQAIVEDGLKIFDKIVIGIGYNSDKHGLLTPENRLRLINDLYEDNDRVEAALYDGLTGQYCMSIGARFLLRGMRNTVDYEYERNMMLVNKKLFPTLTTVLLFTPPQFVAVSSSMIREIIAFGGDATELMPCGVELGMYMDMPEGEK